MISRIIGVLFFISTLFPFLGSPSYDSQPFAAIFGSLFILSLFLCGYSVTTQWNIVWYIIFAIFGCIFAVLVDGKINALTARAVFGYFAISVYYIAFFNYLKYYRPPIFIIYVTLLIWLIVGLVQLVEPTIVSTIVAYRTTPERGVPSLSPEPTYFAIYLFFLSWFFLILTDYKLNRNTLLFCTICLVAGLFLAKSSMFLLYLIISAMFYLARQFRSKGFFYLLFFFIAIASFIAITHLILPTDTRIYSFISSVYSNGPSFMLVDKSSNERISSVALPFLAMLDNYLLPSGFNNYLWFGGIAAENLWPIFPYVLFDKIMSWSMAMWFELGIFGIGAWISLLLLIRLKGSQAVLEFALLFTLLFSAIPHLFPLPIMIMALIQYKQSFSMECH